MNVIYEFHSQHLCLLSSFQIVKREIFMPKIQFFKMKFVSHLLGFLSLQSFALHELAFALSVPCNFHSEKKPSSALHKGVPSIHVSTLSFKGIPITCLLLLTRALWFDPLISYNVKYNGQIFFLDRFQTIYILLHDAM